MKFLLLFAILFSATTQAEISYPVDVENTRWSFYSTNSNKIVRHRTRWPVADGSEINGLSDNIVPLLEVQAPKPAYDLQTEKLKRATPVVDINANTHLHSWVIVPLSQAELDEAEGRADRQNIVDNLGVGTVRDRLNRIERGLRYLLNAD